MLVAMCLCISLPIASPQASAQITPPHIIVMMADDLGWGDVGYNGSEIETPHIDRLARRGTRLNSFYAQPVCSPTRGALLTGRYPMRLGLQCGVVRPWAQHGLPQDERTLPQALKESGYQTAMVGKWHLGHSEPGYLPLQRGFDQQYGHYNGALDYFTHVRDNGFDWHKNDQRNDDEGYATDLIAREAVRVISEHDKRRPLFLYVPFNAPHTPLQAPEEYLAKYADWPNKQRATFAAMVTCMDDAVGDIMKALDDNEFPRTNTLIFFCSDNGGIRRLGSNGILRAGKGTLYEGGIRVPAIMVLQDRLGADRDVDEPLHIVDVFPTLLSFAYASLETQKPIDGRNAWATISRGEPSPHEYILHNSTPFGGALRMGEWKILHNGQLPANAIAAPAQERWELFNIAEDPSESNDIKDEHPEVFEKLKAKLEEFAAQAVEPHLLPNKAPDGFRSPEVWGEF